MNPSKILPLLAAAVIAAGVFVLLRDPAGPTGVVAASQAGSPVSPESGASIAPPTAATLAASPSAVAIPANESGVMDEMGARAQKSRARAEQLEKTWASDAHDPASAPVLEESLVSTLDAERLAEVRDQPIRVSGVDCRATLCRIEAVFPAGKSSSEWGTRLLLELGGSFRGSRMVTLPGAEGESNLVVYAYRASNAVR